jgi:hypothetical protein
LGATNPANAADGTIRELFATDIERNCVHGSDAPATAAVEMPAFFFGSDLLQRSSQLGRRPSAKHGPQMAPIAIRFLHAHAGFHFSRVANYRAAYGVYGLWNGARFSTMVLLRFWSRDGSQNRPVRTLGNCRS